MNTGSNMVSIGPIATLPTSPGRKTVVVIGFPSHPVRHVLAIAGSDSRTVGAVGTGCLRGLTFERVRLEGDRIGEHVIGDVSKVQRGRSNRGLPVLPG